MRCLQIRDGIIVNAILADHTFDPGDGSQIVPSEAGQIGDSYADGAITPAPPPAPVVPASVALWQAKAALEAAGLDKQAEAAVAAANSPALTAFWATAPTIDRTSPTLAKIATALNLTSAQVDALFVQAAAISL